MEFELDKIKPMPDEFSVKDDTRMALVGAPGAVVTLLGAVLGNQLYELSPVLFYSVLSVGVVAMFAGFLFGGKVKAYVFRNRDQTVLFDITERGNSRLQFEAFVAVLRAQIQSAQR